MLLPASLSKTVDVLDMSLESMPDAQGSLITAANRWPKEPERVERSHIDLTASETRGPLATSSSHHFQTPRPGRLASDIVGHAQPIATSTGAGRPSSNLVGTVKRSTVISFDKKPRGSARKIPKAGQVQAFEYRAAREFLVTKALVLGFKTDRDLPVQVMDTKVTKVLHSCYNQSTVHYQITCRSFVVVLFFFSFVLHVRACVSPGRPRHRLQ